MKRTEIVKILRKAATFLDRSEDRQLRDKLSNAANSLVVLKEPLDDVINMADYYLADWPKDICSEKVETVREFNK